MSGGEFRYRKVALRATTARAGDCESVKPIRAPGRAGAIKALRMQLARGAGSSLYFFGPDLIDMARGRSQWDFAGYGVGAASGEICGDFLREITGLRRTAAASQ